MDSKILVRYIFRETMGVAIMGVAMFWPAGRLDWWPAWTAMAVMLAWSAATAIVILRLHPALLADRLGPRKGAKGWDVTLMSLLGVAQLARYALAGFDQRLGWTGAFPPGVQIAALGICILGNALVVWATAANAYFSQIVRLQPERSQAVATGGPYRYVRHPAYTGSILFELAVPVLLASWAALAVSGLTLVLFVLRTHLEDRALQTNLAGYPEYSRQVRYRLLPGLW